MEVSQKQKAFSTKAVLLAILMIASLFAGVFLGYLLGCSNKISDLQNQIATLQKQISNLQLTQGVNQNNTYILGGNVSLSKLYEEVKDSVVTIRGITVQYDISIVHTIHKFKVQDSSTTMLGKWWS